MRAEDFPLHLNEVRTHFGAIMVTGWVAVALALVAILGIADQLSPTPASRYVWPEDIPVAPADAMPLDTAEQEDFDTALLGSAGRAPQLPLEHLPPLPPGPPYSSVLWQTAGAISPRNPRIVDMLKCIQRPSCDATEIESLGKTALPAIGRAGTGPGPCAYEPILDNDKRVPTGLLAIVMGWVPDCHAAAIPMFASFKEQLRGHLSKDQQAIGELYARFQTAKLTDGANPYDPHGFADEMSALRDALQALPQKNSLKNDYEKLRDPPAAGVSMAEIQAEWMWSQARLRAQNGTSAQLGRQLTDLFQPEMRVQSSTGLDPGRRRLQFVWCALALRAAQEAPMSEAAAGDRAPCLQSLLEERASLPAPLVCALGGRQLLRQGRWSPPADCPLDNSAADPRRLMQRVAAHNAVWKDALKSYDSLPTPSPKRVRLRRYLEAYATASGNRLTWLAHEHRVAVAGLVLALLLPLALAVYLIWVWRWQLPALKRVLPPPVEFDP